MKENEERLAKEFREHEKMLREQKEQEISSQPAPSTDVSQTF